MSPVTQHARRMSHLRLFAITVLPFGLLFGLIGLFALLTPTQIARAATRYYVNDNAALGGDGQSWGAAFLFLQDALAVANAGDEIWVAAGVYYPDISTIGGNNDLVSAAFQLETGVMIYGGFAGNEGQLSQRNVAANVTVLSGDLTQNDTRDANDVVIDPDNINIDGPNALHVVTASGVDASARLDGFTITAGKIVSGNSCPDACGSGLYANNGAPALANLTVIGNLGRYGGGMLFHNASSTPSLTDVVIRNNKSTGNGGGLQIQDGANATLTRVQLIENFTLFSGGGIYIHLANARLEEVDFSENRAQHALDGNGGGLNLYQSHPILSGVTFNGNQADSGGGLYLNQSQPFLRDVIFDGNQADYGGGIFSDESSPPTLTNVIFRGNRGYNDGGGIYSDGGNLVLLNVTFSGNQASFKGGGIYATDSGTDLLNVTFSGNHASLGGGIYNVSGTLNFKNTILWDNVPDSMDGVGEGISDFRYSLVQGIFAAVGNNVGNLDGNDPANDPRFVTPVTCCGDDLITTDADGSASDSFGDLHLQAGSPAIDAGDNSVVVTVTSDLADQPRIVAVKSLPAIVDMGAYEASVFAPNANAGGPYSVAEGSPLALNGFASTDDVSIASYGWDCTNDGTIDFTSNAPIGSSCTYPNSGSYTLRLTATDNVNATGTGTTAVAVANVAPEYASAADQSTSAGSVKSFALGSFSDPGAEGTWAVQIDWGDDTTPTQFAVNSPGTLPTKNHTYGAAGTYNVAVTVSDDTDDANEGFQVVVNAAPPGAPNVTAPANQEGTAATDQSFSLGSFTDVGSVGPWQVTVEWGDGSANTLFNVSNSGEILAKPHTYAAAGVYEVSVTVSDGALSFNSTFTVTIPEEVEEGAKTFLPTAAKP